MGWNRELAPAWTRLGVLLLVAAQTLSSEGSALFAGSAELKKLLATRNASSVALTLAGTGSIGAADGVGDKATFWRPADVALLTGPHRVLVADSRNHKIRVLSLAPSQQEWTSAVPTVSTLAGSVSGYQDGKGSQARFNLPLGVAVHPTEAWAAVADTFNNRIRKVFLATGDVQTLVGSTEINWVGYQDGPREQAKLSGPSSVDFSPDGKALVIADTSNHRIRVLDLMTNKVSTLAGTRLGKSRCAFGTWKASGRCSGGRAICMCGDEAQLGPVCETIQGTPPVKLCMFGSNEPRCNDGNPEVSGCKCTKPNTGRECASDSECTLGGICLGAAGHYDGDATRARFNSPGGVSFSSDGTAVFVADTNNHVLRKIVVATGIVSTVSGVPRTPGNIVGSNGKGSIDIPKARFDNPTGIAAYDADLVLLQDSGNGRVRAVSEIDGMAEAMTGWLTCQGGKYISTGNCYNILSECICLENQTDAAQARRCSDGSNPDDLPDTGEPCTCTAANNGATCAKTKDCTGGGKCLSASVGFRDGEGLRAKFMEPRGLAIASTGSFFAVADTGNHRIRLVDCGGKCNSSLIVLDRALVLGNDLLKSASPQSSWSHFVVVASVMQALNLALDVRLF